MARHIKLLDTPIGSYKALLETCVGDRPAGETGIQMRRTLALLQAIEDAEEVLKLSPEDYRDIVSRVETYPWKMRDPKTGEPATLSTPHRKILVKFEDDVKDAKEVEEDQPS